MKTKVEEEITEEVEKLKSIKMNFGLEVKFLREIGEHDQRELEIDRQRHYFKEEPRVIDGIEGLH